MGPRRSALTSLLVSCFALLVSVGLAGCGGGGGGDDGRSRVDASLRALPTWTAFAEVREPAAQEGDVICDLTGSVLCTWKHCSITENPEEIVTFGSAPDVLYLGSLIQGSSYLRGLLAMEELPIRQRAPLTIAVKLLSGTDISRTVMDPNAASVQQALSDIIAEATAHGHKSGSNIFYDYQESHSSTQAALGLRMSYKYLGNSARAALDFETSRELHTVTAYFKQVMFEAYIVRPQTPSQFFSEDFTDQHLSEQVAFGNIGDDNLPVYVSRMQYGRMLVYSMTSSSSVDAIKSAVSASYYGVSAGTSAEVRNVLENARIKVATVGGDENRALALIRTGRLEDYFTGEDPLTTAYPLSYTLCNLADGELAVVSESTEYDVRDCKERTHKLYDNRLAWQNDMAARVDEWKCTNSSLASFDTTPENLTLANEVTWSPLQSDDSLGNKITFSGPNTQFPFDFSLQATRSQAVELIYDDQASYGNAFGALDQQRSISIGEVGRHVQDDFKVEILDTHPNTAVFAMGLTVADNTCEPGNESAQVNGEALQEFMLCFEDQHGFLGVIANYPLTSLKFIEGPGNDNLFVRDFRFGYFTW